MNRQFYEFWGKYFTGVAQGQKQLEDMTNWMNKGFSQKDEMSKLFRSCYGLDKAGAGNTENLQQWQKAMADFGENFSQTASAWGWVSQAEHQKVKERCTELEKEVLQQKATISQLRDLLNQEGSGHKELTQHLKGAFETQNEQFHKLLKTISEASTSNQ